MSETGRGLAKANAAVLLFGLAGLFAKLLDLPPAAIALGRVVFASAALAALAAATGASLAPGPIRALAPLAASGLLLAFHWTAFFLSIRVSTVAIGLVSFAAFPLFVVFLEPAFSRERIRAESLAAALATLAGAAIVAFGPGREGAAGGSRAALAGVLWGLAAAASFALLSLFNKRSVQGRSSLAIAFYQDLFAALALLPLAGGALLRPGAVGLRELGLLAALGLACTALAHTLFISGLRPLAARTAAVIGSLEPVYGTAFALLLLGELPAARTIAGGAIIVGAAVYSSLRSR
jgi:drug/metabolite transporter (DMT)-like permease